MVYFSVAIDSKSSWLFHLSSGIHITISFCLCACNRCTSHCDTYQHATDSCLWFTWMVAIALECGLRSQAEMCADVWLWYIVIVKPGAQHSSTLAGDLWHERARVAAVAYVSANHSLPLTVGNKNFPLYIRRDFYYFLALYNTGSQQCTCFGTGRLQSACSNGLTPQNFCKQNEGSKN